LTLLAGLLIVPAAAVASDPLLEYTGSGNDHLGSAIAFGDVNGNGRPDIVVGADAGGYVDVYEYDGAGLSTRLYHLVGGAAGDAFGSTVATGDINGDGKADIVVGAYSWDSSGSVTDVGYVRAFDGATGTQLFQLQGTKKTDTFGASLALADINGDGKAELLVGAPFADVRGINDNKGFVALYDGATQNQLHRWIGPEHYDEMGRAVAFADINDDGTKDIILGAGSGNGTDYGGFVQVINGANFGQQLYKFTDGKSHVKPEQNFGFAVAAGDVTGDGNDDIVVGAHRGQSGLARTAPTTGYVRVFDGTDGSLVYQVNGVANGDQFGRTVAVADVTGDGTLDVIAGARWAADGGYVRVLDGPTGTVVQHEDAVQAFDWLGSSVAAGDIDLDGKANLGSGAYQGDSRSASQGGYVRIYENLTSP
jgi:hypothetical protein